MIEVSCAIIVNNIDEILVTQRSASMKLPLKWEFPGGKIEKGETAEECLIREIREELGIEIIIQNSLPFVEHHYDDFSIRLMPFICKINAGEIRLTEHAAFLWVERSELMEMDWAEADLPIMETLVGY
jgi:8-oxo-dGTP diphosphatase